MPVLVRKSLSPLALLLVLFSLTPVLAVAVPDALSVSGLAPVERLAVWESPKVDVPGLLQEDAANAGRFDIPYRIGYPMTTDLGPANSGTWETLDDGSRVWRLRVRSAGALWIALGFDVFRLQDGGRLWVYDAAGRTVLGPKTVEDIRDHGELWLPPIEGDSVVVELDWPAKLAGAEPKIHLGTVSHGYKPFGTIGAGLASGGVSAEAFGDSGSCNIDVMCPLGTNWQNEKRGVVMLLSGGSGFCTASLINTTANDCRPYVLTAHHCTAGTSTVFGFNFERPACNSGTPPAPTTQTVSGATVLADYASSDFTLLRMSSAAPESFGAYFSGWNRDISPAANTMVIHHPSGDAKKISRDADPPTDGSNWGTNHWRIGQYEEGTTEPGSSGSPLFDQNHRIVGQLHGGTASCTSLTYDEYGKVSASWVGGGTSATRLSDWLDPLASGALTADGIDYQTCLFRPDGSVALNRSFYTCADTLAITLRDDNLRGNPTQDVTVASGTESAPETVTLTATAPGAGTFAGTFPVSAVPPVHGDGLLSVASGDTITVTYVDLDDGTGQTVVRTATAQADCVAPVISNVQAANVTGNGADITFLTNEPGNTVVHYWSTTPPGTTVTSAALVTNHTVHLANLTGCTPYTFWVESTDAAGNTASADNGGTNYSFITSANVQPTYVSTAPPAAIPDNSPAGVAMTIAVPENKTIQDLNVMVNITHTYDGDLTLSLIGPDNTTIVLSNRRGSGGANFVNTVFDDQASTPIASGSAPFTGSFIPDASLSAFNGKLSAGTWTLKVVDGASSDTGTINNFALTFTFPPEPCPTVGRVMLDKDGYRCQDTVNIQVVDFSILGAGSQAVTIASTTEAAGETITLTETPPNSATFVGAVPVSAVPPAGGDGVLSVSDADTIVVTYIDADDGYGNVNVPRTDTATVDCAAPVISGVQALNVSGNTADIVFITNEPATTVVHYGDTAPPGLTTASPLPVTAHSLHLTGLLPCRAYYFWVQAADGVGNLASSDNAGAYFTFTTGAITSVAYAYSGPAVAIPDNNAAGATVPVVVPDIRVVADVNVKVNVAHAYVGDVIVSLIGPNGAEVILASRLGSSGDNYTNTLFDDQAATPIASGTPPYTGTFKPQGSLAAFNGILANGTWTLKVADVSSGTAGTIDGFELDLTYASQPCGAYLRRTVYSVADACSGGGGGSGNLVVDPGEDLSIPVQLVNTGTDPAAAVVGTISTATPGVAITRATASYGTMAAGAAAYGDLPYLLHVADNIACGTLIDFTVAAVSGEGNWTTDAFSVRVGSPVANTVTYNSTDVPKPIADNSTITSNIVVTDTGTVGDVNVGVTLVHTYDGDLTLTLIAPNGTRVTLSARHGSSGDNYTGTVFDDQATTPIASGTPPYTGSFKPDQVLSALNGLPANGTWKLEVTDSAGGDTGSLTAWSLILTTPGGYACTTCLLAPPGEVPDSSVGFSSDKQTMSWGAVPAASSYHVYEGADADLPLLLTAGSDSCERAVVAGTSVSGLAATPASGRFLWFLVRASNAGGMGPAGAARVAQAPTPRQHDSSGACP